MPIQYLTNTRARFSDGTGKPLEQGTVGVYTAGSSFGTLATVWDTATKDTELTNPVTLDSAGEAEIWYDVAVDLQIKNSSGTVVDTALGLNPNATATTVGNDNLITNGSFEADAVADGQPDNWTIAPETSATIAIDSTSGGQTHGNNGLKFDAAGNGGGTATSTIFDVPAGGSVNTIFNFKQANAATGTYSVVIKWIQFDGSDSGTGNTTVVSLTSGAPTSFTEYKRTDSVPADATQAQLILTGLANGGSDETGQCWFDDVSVSKVTDMTYDDSNNTLLTATLTGNVTGDITGGGTLTSPVINTGVSGTALETTITNTDTKIPTSGAVFDKTGGLNTKVLEIGDWNMDSTAIGPFVAHGLTQSKIRTIQVLIRRDDDVIFNDLLSHTNNTGSGQHSVGISSTTVQIARETGGFYDNINYNSTSFNRGWIIIQYTD